jgi:hypothetical protein
MFLNLCKIKIKKKNRLKLKKKTENLQFSTGLEPTHDKYSVNVTQPKYEGTLGNI